MTTSSFVSAMDNNINNINNNKNLQFGDNGNLEYTWSENNKEKLLQLSFQINEINVKDEDIKGSTDKLIAKKIANLLKKIITIDYKKDNYKIYKVNYFNDIKKIILFNEEEYLYVKDILGLDVHTIRASTL